MLTGKFRSNSWDDLILGHFYQVTINEWDQYGIYISCRRCPMNSFSETATFSRRCWYPYYLPGKICSLQNLAIINLAMPVLSASVFVRSSLHHYHHHRSPSYSSSSQRRGTIRSVNTRWDFMWKIMLLSCEGL